MLRTVTAHLSAQVGSPATLILAVSVASGAYEVAEELTVTRDGEPLEVTEVAGDHGTRLHRVRSDAGDLVVRYRATVTGRDVPPPVRTMVIDASYGEAEETLEHQREFLKAIVARGPTLLPVPPDGRAVEIAMFLQGSGFDVAIVRARVAPTEGGYIRDAATAPPRDDLVGGGRCARSRVA